MVAGVVLHIMEVRPWQSSALSKCTFILLNYSRNKKCTQRTPTTGKANGPLLNDRINIYTKSYTLILSMWICKILLIKVWEFFPETVIQISIKQCWIKWKQTLDMFCDRDLIPKWRFFLAPPLQQVSCKSREYFLWTPTEDKSMSADVL